MRDTDQTDWGKATRKQLIEAMAAALAENHRLRESVTRLMKKVSVPPILHHTSRPEDFVPAGWAERHGIHIPRADGFFESGKAWVRVEHGIITNAGLKNQSVLSLLISRRMLDDGAERHANLYMDWRAAFFARVEAARYSNEGMGDPEAWSKEDRFSKLLKEVDRKCLRRVDVIVTSHPKEKDIASLNDEPDEFLNAFHITAHAINRINQMAEEYLQVIRG